LSVRRDAIKTKIIYMRKNKIIVLITVLLIGLFHQPVKSQIVDWGWHKPLDGLFWDQDMYKKDQSIYLLGVYDSSCVINNISFYGAGEKDVLVVKTVTIGKIIWTLNIGGDSTDVAKNFEVDAQENIYVTGSFKSPILY
jgi:hypothetical protein